MSRPAHEAQDPHNWPEDYDHENGNYCCFCRWCKCWFRGHKRRVACKVCSNAQSSTTE